MCYSGSMKLTNVLFYVVDVNRSTMTNKSPAGTPHLVYCSLLVSIK